MNTERLAIYAAFHPAWKAFAVYFFGGAIFWIGPIFNPQTLGGPALGELIGTLFLAFILIKRFTNIYRLDAREITWETTFPFRCTEDHAIVTIIRIDLRRGVLQRLLGVAHIHLFVEGRDGPAIRLFGVSDPQAFRQLLLDLGAKDTTVKGAWR
jgi:hypothetical protein